MFRFVRALFGCPHQRCTFPITPSQCLREGAEAHARPTYVVCLDCGKEFAYDWQQMKQGRKVRVAA